MNNFESFEIPVFLRNALKTMDINTPTPIQAATIPFALQGRDILASAETGSGKTIAYSLPVISNLIANPESSALILAPTRELVIQVKNNLKLLLGANSPLNLAVLIGGEEMRKQFDQLKRKPRIIIGTPGRICDHLNRTTLKLNNTSFLVLDETDRMLDMGFSEQLEYILKFLSKERQTFMFSATLPTNITQLSQKYLNNPERIQVGEINKPAAKIKQQTIQTRSSEKFSTLVKALEGKNQGSSAIIFVKTKRNAQELSDQLCEQQFNSEAMHGDLSQRQRERVIKDFRSQKTEIIVATDIAARGLDVPHIEYVFNYHLPECPEDYIHRIGRTGRAGVEGFAISLIAPEDTKKWQAIDRLIHGKESNTAFKRNNERSTFSKGKNFTSSNKNSKSSFRDSDYPFSTESVSRDTRIASSDRKFSSDKKFPSDRKFSSDKKFSSDRNFSSDKKFSSDRNFSSDRKFSSDRERFFRNEDNPKQMHSKFSSQGKRFNSSQDTSNAHKKTAFGDEMSQYSKERKFNFNKDNSRFIKLNSQNTSSSTSAYKKKNFFH